MKNLINKFELLISKKRTFFATLCGGSEKNSVIFAFFIKFFNFKMRLSQNYHFGDSKLLLSRDDILNLKTKRNKT